MRCAISLIAIFMLTGCAAPLPKFIEPDPTQTPVARMRTAIPIGVGASVSIHQNSSDICLDLPNGFELPIHTNTSGLAGPSKKLIGMPSTDSISLKNGSEIYIPADKDVTLYAFFTYANSMYRVICRQGFKFTPKKNHDYQIDLAHGLPNNTDANACRFKLSEINDASQGKWELVEVKAVTPVVVPGNPVWDMACKK